MRMIYAKKALRDRRIPFEIAAPLDSFYSDSNMEVGYMTLLQRDRENLELGTTLAIKILKLYHKGMSNKDIADTLQLDFEYVNFVISGYRTILE